MASLDNTIKALQEKQFQEFASQQDKRTRELLQAMEKQTKQMSGDSMAYMDALKDVIEKSGNKSSHQLGESVKQIKDLQQILKAQTDIAEQDRQTIEAAMKATQRQLEDKTTSKFLGQIKDKLSENAIDITSVVAGVTGNSPMMTMATKYVLDKRKQAKEERAAKKKAEGEEALARLVNLESALQSKKNAKEEASIMKESSSSGGGLGGGGGIEQVGLGELTVWNELQAETLEEIRNILRDQFVSNEKWMDNQLTASRNDEENRRESNRQQAAMIAAIEGLEINGGTAEFETGGEGGFLSGIADWLKTGFAGAMGGIGFGAISGALGTALRALPVVGTIATGLGMALKDGWDIASAAFDDDITTSIQGEDIGGVTGSALGAVIGGALGSVVPGIGTVVGAAVGSIVGNMAGDFIGGWVSPNYDQVFADSMTKINATKEALTASMTNLDNLLQTGSISQEEYDAQAALIRSQQALNAQYEAEAREVEAKNASRLALGQQYNELATTIRQMEDSGLTVSQTMYDQLETLETEYNAANDAYEQAATDLQSRVDPTWYQSLSATMMAGWESLQGAASSAWGTMTDAFDSAKGWFAGKIAALDEAFGISEGVQNAVAYVEGKAAELATTVTESVTAAREVVVEKTQELLADAQQGLADATAAVAEGARQVAQATDQVVTEQLAKLNLDDEYQAVKDTVSETVEAAQERLVQATETAKQVVQELGEGADLSDGIDMSDVRAIAGNAGEMIVDGASAAAEAVGEAVGERLEQADALVTSGLAQVGLDDEYDAAKQAVAETGAAVAESATEAAEFVAEKATQVGEALGERAEAASEWIEGTWNSWFSDEEERLQNERLRNDEQEDMQQEVIDALEETVKGVEELELSDRIGGWFSSWFSDDSPQVGTARGNVADNVAASLRPGNAYTPTEVDSGTAQTRRDALVRQMDEQGITDPNERAAIMAQAHHESGGFTRTEENFNYSGRRLFELYGAGNEYGNRVRFNSVEDANALVAQGQSAVGDVIYGGRMGNTDVGDGFKYRGRGAFQLTGRDNYRTIGEQIGVDLESNPELVNDPEIGAKVALAYYNTRVDRNAARSGDIDEVSRDINGGDVGLQHRRDLFASYQREGVPSLSASGELMDSQRSLDSAMADASGTPAPVVIAGGGGGAPIVPSTPQSGGQVAAGNPTGRLTPEEIQIMYGVGTVS
jgi:predicted chitinase